MMPYIKEVFGDTLHLYKYHTFKGKLTLTAIALLSIFNTMIGSIYDMFESHTFMWEGNLRKNLPSVDKIQFHT